MHKTCLLFLFVDPFEQWNRVHALTDVERSYLQAQLAQLKACRGTKQCTVGNAASSTTQMHTGSNTSSSSNFDNTASISSTSSRYKKRKYQSSSKFAIGRLTMNRVYGVVWFWYFHWSPITYVCILRCYAVYWYTVSNVPPKCWYLSNKLHDVTPQKAVILCICVCMSACVLKLLFMN